MLHHVELYVSDLAASRRFWTGLLGHLGYRETASFDGGFTLAGDAETYLTFVQVADRHAGRSHHRCGVGLNHLAFRVADRAAVEALKEYCAREGVTTLYDDRYPFANGGDDYFALFVEDPDRMKVEFVAGS